MNCNNDTILLRVWQRNSRILRISQRLKTAAKLRTARHFFSQPTSGSTPMTFYACGPLRVTAWTAARGPSWTRLGIVVRFDCKSSSRADESPPAPTTTTILTWRFVIAARWRGKI